MSEAGYFGHLVEGFEIFCKASVRLICSLFRKDISFIIVCLLGKDDPFVSLGFLQSQAFRKMLEKGKREKNRLRMLQNFDLTFCASWSNTCLRIYVHVKKSADKKTYGYMFTRNLLCNFVDNFKYIYYFTSAIFV